MSDTTVIAEEAWNCYGNPNIPNPKDHKSSLLNYAGQRCCLGFECEQCGIGPADILGVTIPGVIKGRYRSEIWHLANESMSGYTDFSGSAMVINDHMDMSYETKKKELVELWAEYGWTLVFVKTVRGMNRKLKQLRG